MDAMASDATLGTRARFIAGDMSDVSPADEGFLVFPVLAYDAIDDANEFA